MPMQPSPIAETLMPLLPRTRFFINFIPPGLFLKLLLRGQIGYNIADETHPRGKYDTIFRDGSVIVRASPRYSMETPKGSERRAKTTGSRATRPAAALVARDLRARPNAIERETEAPPGASPSPEGKGRNSSRRIAKSGAGKASE